MHLTEDVVKRLCKTDPATVEHFHIHWVHVDRVRPTSLLRCQCLVSLCLSHADLLKIEGKVLGRCVNLWWVDLSHNRLAGDALATSGLDEFSALGALDLGHNALGPESLAPASEIEVVRLTLAGNAGLGAGDDSYRRTALQRAPAAWVLDDHFVTAAEAASAVEAHEAAAALERKTSPPASPTSPTILEKRTLATLGDGDWNEASAGDTATTTPTFSGSYSVPTLAGEEMRPRSSQPLPKTAKRPKAWFALPGGKHAFAVVARDAPAWPTTRTAPPGARREGPSPLKRAPLPQTQDFTNAAPFAEPGRLPLSRALPRRPSRKATTTNVARPPARAVAAARPSKTFSPTGGAPGTRTTASRRSARPSASLHVAAVAAAAPRPAATSSATASDPLIGRPATKIVSRLFWRPCAVVAAAAGAATPSSASAALTVASSPAAAVGAAVAAAAAAAGVGASRAAATTSAAGDHGSGGGSTK